MAYIPVDDAQEEVTRLVNRGTSWKAGQDKVGQKIQEGLDLITKQEEQIYKQLGINGIEELQAAYDRFREIFDSTGSASSFLSGGDLYTKILFSDENIDNIEDIKQDELEQAIIDALYQLQEKQASRLRDVSGKRIDSVMAYISTAARQSDVVLLKKDKATGEVKVSVSAGYLNSFLKKQVINPDKNKAALNKAIMDSIKVDISGELSDDDFYNQAFNEDVIRQLVSNGIEKYIFSSKKKAGKRDKDSVKRYALNLVKSYLPEWVDKYENSQSASYFEDKLGQYLNSLPEGKTLNDIVEYYGQDIEITSQDATISGFLGELQASLFCEILFGYQTVQTTGTLKQNLLTGKKQSSPVDTFVNLANGINVGLQIKNYNPRSHDIKYYENKIMSSSQFMSGVLMSSSDDLAEFFGGASYYSEYPDFLAQFNSAFQSLCPEFAKCVFGSIKMSGVYVNDDGPDIRGYVDSDGEVNLQLNINNFYIVGDKIISSKTIIQKYLDALTKATADELIKTSYSMIAKPSEQINFYERKKARNPKKADKYGAIIGRIQGREKENYYNTSETSILPESYSSFRDNTSIIVSIISHFGNFL